MDDRTFRCFHQEYIPKGRGFRQWAKSYSIKYIHMLTLNKCGASTSIIIRFIL